MDRLWCVTFVPSHNRVDPRLQVLLGAMQHKKLHAATSRPREGATQDGVVFTYSPVIATDGVPRPRALQCKQCFLVAHEHCAKTTRRGCHGGAALVRMRRETAVDDVIVAASRRESHLTVPAHSPDRGGTKKGFPTQGPASPSRNAPPALAISALKCCSPRAVCHVLRRLLLN